MVCEGGEDRDCAEPEAAAARVSLLLRLQEPHRETRVRLQIHEGSQVRLRYKYCSVDQYFILFFSAFYVLVSGYRMTRIQYSSPVQMVGKNIKIRFQS